MPPTRLLLAAALSAFATVTLPAQQPGGGPADVVQGRLRHVTVATSDVFPAAEVERRPFLGNLVNAVHWQTRESVVRREVWLQPGEVVTADQAAELERNLRALGLFAEVRVTLVPVGDGERVDLDVVTRDRLSLNAGAGASLVGGVSAVNTQIGESNLFGTGNRIGATFRENSRGEFQGSLEYTDLHVLDTWHRADVRVNRTDDGDSFSLALRRPFKHLADPRGYGGRVHHDEFGVDYYRNGDSLAEVQVQRDGFAGDMTWAAGPANRRTAHGFVVTLSDATYDRATGPLGPSIRVPGATRSAFLGLRSSWRLVDSYREVVGLDTLDFVQDLTLGASFGATLGARWRHEQGAGSDLQPEASAHARWAGEPFADVFVDLTARGGLRLDNGRAVGWEGRAGGWIFAMTGGHNAIGANVVYDAVEELQGLPVELTLGEDSGLRGYAAHEFAGTARVRLNVEDRFDTGLELATLRLGLVTFYDAGWIGEDSDLGRRLDSAGIGLRIGSKELLGNGVFRIDVAKPFVDVVGESDGWRISATVGQVIHFGGN